MEKNKNAKGITLVALVVTIVVLIILAGVTINLVLGDNGLIKRAQTGTEEYKKAEANEIAAMNEDTIDGLVGGTNNGEPSNIPSDWTNIKEIKENTPIPKNFYYVGGTIDTGVIISDNVADEGKGESYEVSKTLVGNQFVWIPVPLAEGETFESKYPRTQFSNNAPTTGLSTNYTEPYASGYATEAAEYNAMLTSVNKYKGFYVGRYEAGCTTQRTSSNKTTAQKVVIKQGAYVYNYVPWGASMSSTTTTDGNTGALELSKSLGYTTVNSTLMYGIQWDMILRYVADDTHNVNDSSSWGNYINSTGDAATNSGSLQTTGKNVAWSAKNMYDIAGNVWEWTMEAISSSNHVYRGGICGSHGSSIPASSRGSNSPTCADVLVGFRATLYL